MLDAVVGLALVAFGVVFLLPGVRANLLRGSNEARERMNLRPLSFQRTLMVVLGAFFVVLGLLLLTGVAGLT